MRRRCFYWLHPDILAVGGDSAASRQREVLAQDPGPSFNKDTGWRKIGTLNRMGGGGWRTGCCERYFTHQRDAVAHIAWAQTAGGCDLAAAAEREARNRLYALRTL